MHICTYMYRYFQQVKDCHAWHAYLKYCLMVRKKELIKRNKEKSKLLSCIVNCINVPVVCSWWNLRSLPHWFSLCPRNVHLVSDNMQEYRGAESKAQHHQAILDCCSATGWNLYWVSARQPGIYQDGYCTVLCWQGRFNTCHPHCAKMF